MAVMIDLLGTLEVLPWVQVVEGSKVPRAPRPPSHDIL